MDSRCPPNHSITHSSAGQREKKEPKNVMDEDKYGERSLTNFSNGRKDLTWGD